MPLIISNSGGVGDAEAGEGLGLNCLDGAAAVPVSAQERIFLGTAESSGGMADLFHSVDSNQVGETETIGNLVHRLGSGQWAIPDLRAELEETTREATDWQRRERRFGELCRTSLKLEGPETHLPIESLVHRRHSSTLVEGPLHRAAGELTARAQV